MESCLPTVMQILNRLKQCYPNARCGLVFQTPFQLLVATILSAQCTDNRVNQVTKTLFSRFPDPFSMAQCPLSEMEIFIRSTGFFRNKAKSIQSIAKQLAEHQNGQVPRTLHELTALPGVGRKTANVVLNNAFGIASGVVVDTHVKRVTKRLGLTTHDHPDRIEEELKNKIPKKEWILFPHMIISHGRTTCKARRPLCQQCPLGDICPKVGLEISK